MTISIHVALPSCHKGTAITKLRGTTDIKEAVFLTAGSRGGIVAVLILRSSGRTTVIVVTSIGQSHYVTVSVASSSVGGRDIGAEHQTCQRLRVIVGRTPCAVSVEVVAHLGGIVYACCCGLCAIGDADGCRCRAEISHVVSYRKRGRNVVGQGSKGICRTFLLDDNINRVILVGVKTGGGQTAVVQGNSVVNLGGCCRTVLLESAADD